MISYMTRGSKGLSSLQPCLAPLFTWADPVVRLERIVRDATANREFDRIAKIVDQLCHDYAYAVHQPYARNGGLIGLAAASIALGSVRQETFHIFASLTARDRTRSRDI